MFILSHGLSRAALFFTLFSLSAQAANSEEPLSLEFLLKSTLSNNGQIQESLQDVDVARAQLQQARAALFPRAQAVVIGAPIFEERGNAVESRSNWSKWGPYFQGSAEIIQPLYTFGQISSYRRAAESQIVAKNGLADVTRSEVLMNTKEFFYGYCMATELEGLVEKLISFLEDAVTSAEEQANDKSDGKKVPVKPHDIYKLKSALEDLRQKKLLATQSRRTAEKAVSWVTGVKLEGLQKRALVAETFEKKQLEEYLSMAKKFRPEFQALAAGQDARLALRDAKLAQNYPVLFVGAAGTAAWSPVRDRQNSIFANDPFNRVFGGVGLGLKFDLEFKKHSAEAAEQEAEAMKLKAKETYAAPGIELQVKKAYYELEQAIEGLEIATRRKEIGKKWFVSNAMGWSIGITSAKDLLESLEGDGVARKNYVETVYSLNMALARLSQAVGKELTSLSYGR